MGRWPLVLPTLAALLLTGCGGGNDGAARPGTSSSASSSASSGESTASETPSTGNTAGLLGPVGLAQAADGTVWAAWAASDVIAPLDGEGRPTDPVEVGDTPLRMVPLKSSLWVTTIRGGGLVEVDTVTSTVVREVAIGEEPEGLAVLGDHLFVVVQAGQALVEVDPADGALLRRYDVGGAPRLVTAGDDALYVGDFEGGRVVRVVPGRAEKVTGSEAVCGGVQDLHVVNGRVWAACMNDNTVVGLDPVTLEVTSTVPVDGGPDGLTPGPGADLVVSLQDGPGLAVVDMSAGTSEQVWTGTTGRLLDKANTDVVERDGTAFVSDYLGDAVRVVRLEQ